MTMKLERKRLEQKAARDALQLFSGEASSSQLSQMIETCRHSEEYETIYDNCNEILIAAGQLEQDADLLNLVADYPDASGEAHHTCAGENPKRFRYALWGGGVAIAAAILLAVSSWPGFFSSHTTGQSDILRYVTRVGEQKLITLPDKSTVHLNTASTLLVEYSENHRRLTLERGEAYFDVVSDPTKPFSVDVGYRSITVLGTMFNIRRDPDQFQLAVVEGQVALHRQGDVDLRESSLFALDEGELSARGVAAYEVKAGSVVEYDNYKQIYSVAFDSNIEKYSSWTDGLVRFADVPLSRVIQELNRYSARKILIEDTEAMSLPVWATVQVDDVMTALTGLEKTQPIRLVLYSDRILIRSESK